MIALLLAGPVTAHARISAADYAGIPQSKTIRDDLTEAMEQSHPSVEKDMG